MKKILIGLSREMSDKGYPPVSVLQADGNYHRFAIQGHKEEAVSKLFPKRAD
jgi:hypothetical protein